MKKWLLCVGVVLAFLFAVVPFLSAAEVTSTTRPAAEMSKPVSIPKLTDEQKAKAERLIKDLGSDDFATREAAEEALKKMGVAALPLVKKHMTSSDVEIAQRAAQIVEHLRGQLPAGPSKVKITLSLNKRKYKIGKVGETIKVTVRFLNQSKKNVLLLVVNNQHPWRQMSNYVLTGPDGKAVAPEENKGNCPRVTAPTILHQTLLHPNVARVERVQLKLLGDMGLGDPKIRPPRKAGSPAGFLRDWTSNYHFPIAKAGKYTLKLRFVAKVGDGDVQQQDRVEHREINRRRGAIQLKMGAGGAMVLTRRVGPKADNGGAKPTKVLFESNEVTFEIVK